MNKLIPPVTRTTENFFEGCRVGELRLQICEKCSLVQFYPRIVCSACSARSLKWISLSGRAKLLSYTVVRKPLTKAYDAPYVVILVELAEGPRMMSQLLGDFQGCQIGDPLEVEFVDWGEGISLPVFKRI